MLLKSHLASPDKVMSQKIFLLKLLLQVPHIDVMTIPLIHPMFHQVEGLVVDKNANGTT